MSTEAVVDHQADNAVGVAEVAALLRERGPALVLTGAGISTESGIPDYRGPDGNRRVTPMSHQEFTATSAARQRYWARSFIGWQRFTAAEPNAGHVAVARLQRVGAFGDVITQNVDGLHQQAGASNVIELHGTLSEVECLTCGERTDRDFVQALMDDANHGFAALALGLVGDGSQVSSQIRPDGDIVLADEAVQSFTAPRCLVCGHDTLKPDVVFFGGSVPKPRVEACFELTDAAPALVVLGSSLKVMSGYRFVRRAAANGIPVVVVTKGPTRGDAETTHRIDAPLGVTLSALADELAPAS
ncbi:Sir2 family NAD-dependent protein deacetylase [Knoellia subterranea]|uniref:protein acetyllysine N-acetyltransferase n=1 Tax=Knoellia subterranea KCTC 19937 TaxID=1385521 RepID=A0A0A0JFG7_9MICO|nr:Sir2 family NAD-dependent protein deacetylase [Knoellia subterranea]KGN35484.1 NAD-dependent deacetylase [Knoellia subterranea KCTC 19937]